MFNSPKNEYRVITVRELKRMFDSGELNLNPNYQRSNTWEPTRKKNLIFSLVSDLGYIIPPLALDIREEKAKGKSNLTRKTYDVVDGKQRITSILEFIEGKTLTPQGFVPAVKGSMVKIAKRSEYNQLIQVHSPAMDGLYNRTFASFTDDEKEGFLSLEIGAYFLSNYAKHAVTAVFSVLQEQQRLSMAEQIAALDTLISQTARTIKDDYAKVLVHMSQSDKRASHQDLITSLLAMVLNRSIEFRKASLQKLVAEVDASQVETANIQVRMFLDFFFDVLEFADKFHPEDIAIMMRKSRLTGIFEYWLQEAIDNSGNPQPRAVYSALYAMINGKAGKTGVDYVESTRYASFRNTKRVEQAQLIAKGVAMGLKPETQDKQKSLAKA